MSFNSWSDPRSPSCSRWRRLSRGYVSRPRHLTQLDSNQPSTSLYWNYVYHAVEPADTEKFLEFHDDALKRLYSHSKMPISTFYEEFMHGRVGLKGDMWETLDEHRYEFLNFKVTFRLCKWLIFQVSVDQKFKGLVKVQKRVSDRSDVTSLST